MTAAVSFATENGIALRPGEQGDAHYVMSTWLRTYGHRSSYADAMGQPFWTEHHDAIARLLARSVTMVACADEDPETIIAFAVYEPPDERIVPNDATLVHWVQVRKEFRGHGIARRLLAPVRGRVIVTHLTRGTRIPAGWSVNLYRGLR